MSVRLKHHSHAVTGLFVFALIAVFAILAMLLVIIGAQTYRSITDSADLNAQRRMATSYIANRIRSSDRQGNIRVEEYDGTTALVLASEVDGEAYETRIYCENGELREQYVSAADPFDPEIGQTVSEIGEMRVSMENDRMILVEIEQLDGTTNALHVSLRSE